MKWKDSDEKALAARFRKSDETDGGADASADLEMGKSVLASDPSGIMEKAKQASVLKDEDFVRLHPEVLLAPPPPSRTHVCSLCVALSPWGFK